MIFAKAIVSLLKDLFAEPLPTPSGPVFHSVPDSDTFSARGMSTDICDSNGTIYRVSVEVLPMVTPA